MMNRQDGGAALDRLARPRPDFDPDARIDDVVQAAPAGAEGDSRGMLAWRGGMLGGPGSAVRAAVACSTGASRVRGTSDASRR